MLTDILVVLEDSKNSNDHFMNFYRSLNNQLFHDKSNSQLFPCWAALCGFNISTKAKTLPRHFFVCMDCLQSIQVAQLARRKILAEVSLSSIVNWFSSRINPSAVMVQEVTGRPNWGSPLYPLGPSQHYLIHEFNVGP